MSGSLRLLICLYAGENGHALLHVELKFVALPDIVTRVDEPTVLQERDGRLCQVLAKGAACFPAGTRSVLAAWCPMKPRSGSLCAHGAVRARAGP